ncbi:MAG: hydroxyphenylacetyl-CoA thioesterase PaaI [Rhodospirillales bacterium]|nr:hydroxyphenylacetyl-CoA thioesterase PaaI [Rhodospirillales bacterium]
MANRERAQQVADAVGRVMYEKDHCSQAMGITLDDIGPGYARMSMTLRGDMVNGHGTAHGGMIFTLADATFAYACNSHNHIAVAASCDIVFPAAGKLGDRLTAIAEERHVRGRNGVYDVTVTNQIGEVIAMFRGHSRRLQGHVVPELEFDHV